MSPNHSASTNPLAAPCVMVIFGASGDLTKRKLIPALCNLAGDNLLSKQFAIVGFAGNDYTTESFRKMLGEEVPKYTTVPVGAAISLAKPAAVLAVPATRLPPDTST